MNRCIFSRLSGSLPAAAASFLLLSLLATIAGADEIVLKDGTKIVGQIVSLVDGKLKVKTESAGELTVQWAGISTIDSDSALPFHLAKGSVLKGMASTDAAGAVTIQTEDSPNPIPIAIGDVTAINPPAKKLVTYKGFVTAGGSVTDGNTRTRSASASGEFVARSARQRFTISGAYNYAEDEEDLTARNARGSIKYDFFMTKRFYLFSSALFEGDSFQDLKLRTALSAGPGYQFIDRGDFTEDWLRELELSAEAGISYFNEDYDGGADDDSYVSARWAVKLDWAIIPDRLTLFHNHEGFPGLENARDLYIRTEQGVRLTIIQNFFASLGVNWRWDNTPAAGRKRSDTIYLLSLGYNFNL